MASVNKVILVGNLGADPETRYAPGGDAICNIRLATTDTWKDKTSGEKKEATEWHRVVFYRKLAEIAGQYLKKGAAVYIEGRIKTLKWTDKEGQERYTTEIEATEMQMLGKREGSGADSAGTQPPAPQKQAGGAPRSAQGAPRDNFDPDDIPFNRAGACGLWRVS